MLSSPVSLYLEPLGQLLLTISVRIFGILCLRGGILIYHDLQNLPEVREKKPSLLPICLCNSGFRISHVCQGLWHSTKVDNQRKQSVYPSVNVRLCYRCCRLDIDSVELFQQGT